MNGRVRLPAYPGRYGGGDGRFLDFGDCVALRVNHAGDNGCVGFGVAKRLDEVFGPAGATGRNDRHAYRADRHILGPCENHALHVGKRRDSAVNASGGKCDGSGKATSIWQGEPEQGR